MKLLNFTIIKFALCLIAGIVVEHFINVSDNILFSILGIVGLLLISSYAYWVHKRKGAFGFEILIYAAFVLIGILSTYIYDETNKTSHYTNTAINYLDYQDLSFTVTKRLKSDTYNSKYIVELQQLNRHSVTGQLVLNLKQDSLHSALHIGSSYFINTKLSEIVKPRNPFQFNYSTYLKQRNIHHQFYASRIELLRLPNKSISISGYADTFRTLINNKLKQAGFKTEILAVINALLLGQRQDISPKTYNNYINAGSVHILAVSGLHVGIIFILLAYILKPLHHIKHGKHILKPIIMLFVLWGFAFIAGLSPSVTRAVTMFSILAVAQFFKTAN